MFGLAFRNNAPVPIDDLQRCLLPDATGTNVCEKLRNGAVAVTSALGKLCTSTCVAESFFNTADWSLKNGTFVSLATLPDPWTPRGNEWLQSARAVCVDGWDRSAT